MLASGVYKYTTSPHGKTSNRKKRAASAGIFAQRNPRRREETGVSAKHLLQRIPQQVDAPEPSEGRKVILAAVMILGSMLVLWAGYQMERGL